MKKIIIIMLIILISCLILIHLPITVLREKMILKVCSDTLCTSDPGMMSFEYNCKICGKDAWNSGSSQGTLCKNCSTKYNRCWKCGGKIIN